MRCGEVSRPNLCPLVSRSCPTLTDQTSASCVVAHHNRQPSPAHQLRYTRWYFWGFLFRDGLEQMVAHSQEPCDQECHEAQIANSPQGRERRDGLGEIVYCPSQVDVQGERVYVRCVLEQAHDALVGSLVYCFMVTAFGDVCRGTANNAQRAQRLRIVR